MKTILVPVDFSTQSDNACKYASAIAARTKSRILLLHTYESTVLFSALPMTTFQFDAAVLQNTAAKNLNSFYLKIKKKNPEVVYEMMLLQGLPSSCIIDAALEKKAELIVMGTSGKGAMERAMLGSNTVRVIRNAPCLVLAVPPKAKFKGLNKITYATDLLNNNIQHSKILESFAKKFDSEIQFLHVHPESLKYDHDKALEQIRKKVEKQVAYKKKSFHVSIDSQIGKGLEKFIMKYKPECLTVYTRQRTILQTIFNPGIAKKIIINNSIPVLVIHETDYFGED